MMTKQEIFNTVCKHLIDQGQTSKGDDYYCAYRGDNGLKCAVGCLIKDECYSPTLEGSSVLQALVVRALVCSSVVDEPDNEDDEDDEASLTPEIMLLRKLQSVHDNIEPIYWPEHLLTIARHNGLTSPNCIFKEGA